MHSIPSSTTDIPVSARILALYRAIESERPDALFYDPYARKLAGEQAQAMIQSIPQGSSNGWTLVIRTKVIDDFVLHATRSGVDTVVNLAAGLDTRPYRLALPPQLHWIEIDRPQILNYKKHALEHVVPCCKVEQLPLDLADCEAYRETFSTINQQARQALVIAEGSLVYLVPEQVAALATDLYAQSTFLWWLISLSSPYLLKKRQKTWQSQISRQKETMKFAPVEGGSYFQRYNWEVAEARFTLAEARRLGRPMPASWSERLWNRLTFKEARELSRRQGGYILLKRL
jgi:methyltransferase (TIGR00027 family)